MSALALRVIACLTMLIDHIGYCTNNEICRIIGRIAFPIFVFLIVNGFRHTSNKGKYALRLTIFALISQIPFSLFSYHRWDVMNGNVMFTLLLGLLCVWSADELRKNQILRWFCWLPAAMVCILYHFGVLQSDYGARGILLALVFYFLDKPTWPYRILTVGGVLISTHYEYLLSLALRLVRGNFTLPWMSHWSALQTFGLFALVCIFLYNGKKGKYPQNPILSKVLQYGFYGFYPLHMLLLWLIMR